MRVRQIPAAHAYVEHLLPVEGDDEGPVRHLSDPPVPGADPGQWWPHPALEPTWVREHADEQDLVHLHFGTEGRTTAALASWIGTLRRCGLPLVHTVHDLDHPHLRDQRRHAEHLDLLVQHADGLLTLTEGAADVVQARHGRRPLVVPHPHVVPLARMGMPSPGPAAPAASSGSSGAAPVLRVGMHLKSLRTNLAPLTVLPALVEAVGVLRDRGVRAILEVRAHPEVPAIRSGEGRAVARWLHTVQEQEPRGVEVVVEPRLDDAQLWDYLEGLDVSVLPYAWGTHSGWVEACRDLGTWVLAPEVGHLAEQGGVLTWGPAGVEPDVDRLVTLLQQAVQEPAEPLSVAQRCAERDRGAQVHAEVYRRVLAGERVDGDLAEGAQVGGGAEGGPRG